MANITAADGPYYPIDANFNVELDDYILIDRRLYIAFTWPFMSDKPKIKSLYDNKKLLMIGYTNYFVLKTHFVEEVTKRYGEDELIKLLKRKESLEALRLADEKLYKKIICGMWLGSGT